MTQPSITEQTLPDQTGKVFIITGATAGVGKELARLIYAKNGTIFITARSEGKAEATITELKASFPNAKGQLDTLMLDFSDLDTIKPAVDSFLAKESKLDVLFNNAGVMHSPQGSKTKQGYELQLGTNNIGPFLFTKLLTPILLETARLKTAGSVRVVWVSSQASHRYAPKGGVEMNNLDYKQDRDPWTKYGTSKAGNIFHATEYARRYPTILSTAVDPGLLKTDLYKTVPFFMRIISKLVLKDPIHGAYAEAYGGFSQDITSDSNGAYVEPPGKISKPRQDVEQATKSIASGGTGVAEQFWEWSERQVSKYV